MKARQDLEFREFGRFRQPSENSKLVQKKPAVETSQKSESFSFHLPKYLSMYPVHVMFLTELKPMLPQKHCIQLGFNLCFHTHAVLTTEKDLKTAIGAHNFSICSVLHLHLYGC